MITNQICGENEIQDWLITNPPWAQLPPPRPISTHRVENLTAPGHYCPSRSQRLGPFYAPVKILPVPLLSYRQPVVFTGSANLQAPLPDKTRKRSPSGATNFMVPYPGSTRNPPVVGPPILSTGTGMRSARLARKVCGPHPSMVIDRNQAHNDSAFPWANFGCIAHPDVPVGSPPRQNNFTGRTIDVGLILSGLKHASVPVGPVSGKSPESPRHFTSAWRNRDATETLGPNVDTDHIEKATGSEGLSLATNAPCAEKCSAALVSLCPAPWLSRKNIKDGAPNVGSTNQVTGVPGDAGASSNPAPTPNLELAIPAPLVEEPGGAVCPNCSSPVKHEMEHRTAFGKWRCR